MRGLFKALTPLAPDQSGAVSALYELGGILVICDAGGCTGNICGFDEPRWSLKPSAIFSAGLRDMDAILGRDHALIAKITDFATKFKANFVALIGTPVPAVIATDFKGLERLGAKKIPCPILSIPTLGTKLYDQGAELAFLNLGQRLLSEAPQKEPQTLSILGATPLDLGLTNSKALVQAFESKYSQVEVPGLGFGLEAFLKIPKREELLVIAPSGLALAKYCAQNFGTPYKLGFPLEILKDNLLNFESQCLKAERFLIIHQHILAASLREKIKALNPKAKVTLGSFFMTVKELFKEEDQKFSDEDSFKTFLETKSFDLIIADQALKRVVPNLKTPWIDLPHLALSGRLLT